MIGVIADSLERDPNQFSLEVRVVGAMGMGGSGGPGISATAIGGEPGSETTGFRAEASAGSAEISQRVGGAVEAELAGVIATLRELAVDVENEEDTHGALLERLNQYAALPASLASVVATCLRLAGVA